jgi:C4-dicarboxylate-specific signal transduction histidine kinase
MRRSSETVLLLLVGALPIAVAVLAAYIGDEVFLTELAKFETIHPQGYWRPALMIVAGVAVLSAALAWWIARVLRRYREQVSLRENALREFNATLESKVAEEVGKQRREDRKMLRQARMNALAEMSAMAMHRWQDPIETLRHLLHEAETKRFSEVVTAKQQLDEMQQVLEYLHQTFQPAARREPVDVAQCAAEALALLEAELDANTIAVRTQLECSVTLPLRRNELLQVLSGVLRNAMDVLVERDIEFPRIELECYETGQFVVIRICDNGGGVDAADADKIFEPYFTTKTGRACGLDLFLARSVIEEHYSGELTFDNLKEGACFYIKIGKHQEEDA